MRADAKIVLTRSELKEALGLPDDMEIVRIWTENDPAYLAVHIRGEDLGSFQGGFVEPDGELPWMRLSQVRR